MTFLTRYRFVSPVSGMKLLVLGAVHGNEHCGTKACEQIIRQLQSGQRRLQSGEICLIPVCNPQASAKDIRQIDENLNRIIRAYPNPKTYEQCLADELNRDISQADVIIDLHSTFARSAGPFVFSDYPDPLADRLSAVLDIRYIIKGWPEVYAQNNTVQDFSTGYVAHVYGKTALTVECGQHADPEAVATAISAIDKTMQVLGLIPQIDAYPQEKEYVMMDRLFLKEKNGRLAKEFHHLDPVKRGETLAVYDDGSSLVCPKDGYMLLPKAYADVNAEWFYLGHLQK